NVTGVQTYALPISYHNGILTVISSPRHKSYQQIPSKRKLTLIRSTAIGQRFAFTHFVAHFYNRLLVDGSALVRTLEFRQLILLNSIVKVTVLFLLRTFVLHMDLFGADVDHFAIFFGRYSSAGIFSRTVLKSCTNHRCFRAKQRHGLTLHIR